MVYFRNSVALSLQRHTVRPGHLGPDTPAMGLSYDSFIRRSVYRTGLHTVTPDHRAWRLIYSVQTPTPCPPLRHANITPREMPLGVGTFCVRLFRYRVGSAISILSRPRSTTGNSSGPLAASPWVSIITKCLVLLSHLVCLLQRQSIHVCIVDMYSMCTRPLSVCSSHFR